MSFVRREPPEALTVQVIEPPKRGRRESPTERHHREWAEGLAQPHTPMLKDTDMKRAEILDAAKEIITKDRHDTHGAAEDSFAQIAGAWSWYLSRPVTAFDVAQMMVLFKIARMKHNPRLVDNAVDQVGYSALAGEIAQR